MLYISNISHLKLGNPQKYIPLKWRSSYAIQAYKQVFKIHISPLLIISRQSRGKNIFWYVLNLLNFIILRNGKVQDKKLESFWNKHLKFLWKNVAEHGKEKLFRNDSSFLSNLKNAKQILSWQSKFHKFLQTDLPARSNVPHFYTKTLSSYWKWKTLEGKSLAIFHDAKNRFIFLITHLFLVFVNKDIFFEKYTEMELKMFFIIFAGFFEQQK